MAAAGMLIVLPLLAFLCARCVCAAPLDVGSAKQVFVDGRFVASSEGVRLVVNRPRPTGERLITGDKPWEDFWVGGYMSVIQEEDRIRLWYECADTRGGDHVAYAESTDGGATWTKPNLGVIEYEGSRDNNLVVGGIHGATVFRNRPDAQDAERYGMYVGRPNQAFYSPDGFRWTETGKTPFLDKEVNPHLTLDSQNVVFWDTRLGQYVVYARFNVPTSAGTAGIVRSFGRGQSDTSGDFGRLDIVLRPDDHDPVDLDFYTTAAIQYPFAADAYYAFPAAYHHTPPPPANDGPIDIQFAASRDGIGWLRPDRRPIVRLGPDGAWNAGCLYAGHGLSRQGDELSLYYKASDITHGAYPALDRGPGGTITRARYRLDGFMSMDASYEGGEFTTPPLVFEGDRLEINFDGSAGGWAQVEILDAQGQPVAGFAQEDADRVTGNAVDKPVTWRGSGDVSALAGTPIKLRFVMRDAKLYAFQFGASGRE